MNINFGLLKKCILVDLRGLCTSLLLIGILLSSCAQKQTSKDEQPDKPMDELLIGMWEEKETMSASYTEVLVTDVFNEDGTWERILKTKDELNGTTLLSAKLRGHYTIGDLDSNLEIDSTIVCIDIESQETDGRVEIKSETTRMLVKSISDNALQYVDLTAGHSSRTHYRKKVEQ